MGGQRISFYDSNLKKVEIGEVGKTYKKEKRIKHIHIYSVLILSQALGLEI